MKKLKDLLFIFIYLYIFLNSLLPYNLKIKIPVNGDLILSVIFFIYMVIVIKDINAFKLNVKEFFHDYLGLALTILLSVMLISIFYAAEKKLALSESLRFLIFIVFYFIIKYEADNERYKKGLINSYLITLVITSVLGLIQALTGMGLEHKFYVDPIARTGERISCTFGNPNSFAAFLIIGIFPVIMLMFSEKRKSKKFLYGIIFISMMFNIYLTASRNSWLAFALGCVILSVIYNWRFLVGISVIGIVAELIPQTSRRLAEINNSYFNESRLKLWGIAIKMIKEHPLFGVGNGNYVSLYDSYVKKYPQLSYGGYTRFPSHNSYLKIESELGIFGGLAFLAVLSSIIYKVRAVTVKFKDGLHAPFYIGFLSSALVFLFMNFFDNLLFVPKVAVYFWIFAALADALLLNDKKKN